MDYAGCQFGQMHLLESAGMLDQPRPKVKTRLEQFRDENICYKLSPFNNIPLEVLGNIFLEYYYDEEVQKNSGYFIGANWKRWSRPGSPGSVANLAKSELYDNAITPEPEQGNPATVLGLVCRSWRRAFLTTPRLWSSIRIWLDFPYHFYNSNDISMGSLNRRTRDLTGMVNEINLHLKRSRAAPLSVEIHTNCLDGTTTGGMGAGGEVLDLVLATLAFDMRRIEDLVIKRTDFNTPRRITKRPPVPPVSPMGATGLLTPPYPGSPCTPRSRSTVVDESALDTLESFIKKLDHLETLTMDNWGQDAVLNLMASGQDGQVLSSLQKIKLLACAPTFCCNGIPWSQLTRFTSYSCTYNYGQILELIQAMPLLTHLDVRFSYNDPGVMPSAYPSPLPSPNPGLNGRNAGFYFDKQDRARTPPAPSQVILPSLTYLNLHGLVKSVQLLLGSIKAPRLSTLRLNTYDAGAGTNQFIPAQSPCESLYRFLRRSQCAVVSMMVDAMFLIPPQPAQPPAEAKHDPNYVYSYILKPNFAPLQSLKKLIIGRGPREIMVKLLLALAWRGESSSLDAFPLLEEVGCEMKVGTMELDALAAVVMSRIPSRVMFIRRSSEEGNGGGRRCTSRESARLWPIAPAASARLNRKQSSREMEDDYGNNVAKKFPARLKTLHVPNAKSNPHPRLHQHFRSWFVDFPKDPEQYLPHVNFQTCEW